MMKMIILETVQEETAINRYMSGNATRFVVIVMGQSTNWEFNCKRDNAIIRTRTHMCFMQIFADWMFLAFKKIDLY